MSNRRWRFSQFSYLYQLSDSGDEPNNADEEGIVIDDYDDFDDEEVDNEKGHNKKKSSTVLSTASLRAFFCENATGAQNRISTETTYEFPNESQKAPAKPDAYEEDVTKIQFEAPKSDLTDDIITEKYYCALCQVSCGFSKPPRMNWEWDAHLNSREHKNKMKVAKKANKEKKKSKAKEKSKTKKNEFPKGTTMFMKGFKNGTTREDIKNALLGIFGVESKALASV